MAARITLIAQLYLPLVSWRCMRASTSGGKTICMVFEMRGVDSIVGDSLRDSGASPLQLDWFFEGRSFVSMSSVIVGSEREGNVS